ncbi:MAG: chorismate mutase [Pigmentiphaga sp.]|nr:chorismate mutase [Pigmentiphaga sp.]
MQQEPDPQGRPLRRFTDPNYQPLAETLAGLRQEIDQLDTQIVELLSRRAMLVKDAARFKADAFQVSAPQRQQQVFDLVRRKAQQANRGFEGFEDVVETAYRALVAGFIAQEQCYFNDMETCHAPDSQTHLD